ncbi:MAG: SDR family oxidoreductase [Rhizorhabdus sp.]
MTPLADKIAVVTGAASGIGRSAALALARRGVRVVLSDINQAGIDDATAAVAAGGGEAIAIAADVGRPEGMEIVRDAAVTRFGEVDIVMNNVGVLVSGRPEDIPLAEWERIINLNLMSVIRSVHLFIPGMIARGSGHIVNTASFAGLFAYAYDRLPYAASKAAIVALSEGLALYLRPKGVGVTCLCPGPVKTAIGSTMKRWTPDLGLRGPGPQFAMLDPDDVGEMVADAIERDRFFLPTDDQVREVMQRRAADPDRFLDEQIAAWS